MSKKMIPGNPITSLFTNFPFGTLYGGTGGSDNLNDGQLWIGEDGQPPVVANLTAGSGMTITNGPGSITIDSNTAAGGGFEVVVGLDGVTPQPGFGYVFQTTPASVPLNAEPNLGDTYFIAQADPSGGVITISNSSGTFGSGIVLNGTVYSSIQSTTAWQSIILTCVDATTFNFMPQSYTGTWVGIP